MAGWQGACGPEASIVGQDGAAAGKAETWAENAPGAPPAPAGRRPGGGGGGDGPMPRRASLRGLKSRIIVFHCIALSNRARKFFESFFNASGVLAR